MKVSGWYGGWSIRFLCPYSYSNSSTSVCPHFPALCHPDIRRSGLLVTQSWRSGLNSQIGTSLYGGFFIASCSLALLLMSARMMKAMMRMLKRSRWPRHFFSLIFPLSVRVRKLGRAVMHPWATALLVYAHAVSLFWHTIHLLTFRWLSPRPVFSRSFVLDHDCLRAPHRHAIIDTI